MPESASDEHIQPTLAFVDARYFRLNNVSAAGDSLRIGTLELARAPLETAKNSIIYANSAWSRDDEKRHREAAGIRESVESGARRIAETVSSIKLNTVSIL